MTPPENDAPTPLAGVPVVVSKWLAGCKIAVRVAGTVYVSPSMRSLMKDATPDELDRLLQAIPLLDIPEPPRTVMT